MTRSQLDVAFERISEQNFSTINIEPVIPGAAVGRLSRLIENNLKAPSDFRVHRDTENLSEVAEFRYKKYSANTSIPVNSSSSAQQTKPVFGIIEAPTARTSRCNFNGKTTLDKYFRVAKTSRRLRDLNPGKLSVAVSDISVKIPDKRPYSSPEIKQRTDIIKDNKLLFTKHFLKREYCILYFIHPSISKNYTFPSLCMVQHQITL